ncbi:TPA: DEAD/DEAH box helicase family protein [Escherichia coli]|uniref:DEAD/DEAH box helicase n=2 Tax=Enterobacter hormaechei TaxID=158836 RepID=UPI000BA0E85C|nr:DEAD/DEAH box helicase family protein [Enterobacter hormaechei]ELI9004133.1 DEAD/DEAH box helicase family protein [Enterobacter roggenkampii]RRC41031.1 diguanylate cyclase [Escherichia coli]HDS1079066.1 DEAD/DEAH box helicase family protein [Pluralibacter gergoviae]MCE1233419.1 DEAD/DEAH box helicase family protein [Enterobacter hormaechei]MCE1338729.1 DEAD/DEAH box helicase family protein [Enterobacter hormaechei]
MLREWQKECSEAALEKYQSGSPHFLCLASPGAGKTVMAAEVARKMLELKLVDLILCFAPSSVVVASIESTFSHILQRNFNGGLGAVGAAYTYHSLMYFDKSFWKSLQMHRVLVIFDEIHHCSGDSLDNANVWGGEILSQVQQCASYSLALTGTPWRTDSTPIVLSNYTDPDGEICCDYVYGLHEAIVDGVCRKPKIALINSNNLVYSSKDNVQFFGSITDFLSETVASYQSIIWHPEAMKYVLEAGCKKLNEIRKVNSDAGGLVVASSVEHAYKLLNILEKEFDQTAIIVTYHDRDALAKIGYYRQSTTEWIVSVGMISEGTDIPRLQVCCHLSSVKTELYFRQVLGRILRVNQSENQEAWLFTMATNELTLFSNRLAEDLPEDYKVMQQQSDDWSFPTIDSQSMPPEFVRKNGISKIKEIDLEMDIGEITKSSPTISSQTKQLKMGSMHQQVIDAFLFSII